MDRIEGLGVRTNIVSSGVNMRVDYVDDYGRSCMDFELTTREAGELASGIVGALHDAAWFRVLELLDAVAPSGSDASSGDYSYHEGFRDAVEMMREKIRKERNR